VVCPIWQKKNGYGEAYTVHTHSRYLADFIEDVEDNGRVRAITPDRGGIATTPLGQQRIKTMELRDRAEKSDVEKPSTAWRYVSLAMPHCFCGLRQVSVQGTFCPVSPDTICGPFHGA
jgi:hypothetical protein